MPHRGNAPTNTNFIAWFDALPVEARQEIYAETCSRFAALGLCVTQTKAYFSQAALELLARRGTEISLN